MNTMAQLLHLILLSSASLVLAATAHSLQRWSAPTGAVTPSPARPECPEIAPDRRCACESGDVRCDALGISDLRILFPLAPNIRKLSASRNQLSGISGEALAGAENLTTLKLQYNSITHFDTGVLASFSSLQFLDLSYNQLTEFDLGDVSLPNLQFLHVTGNSLIRLHLNPSVSKLRSVVADDNLLTEVSNSFPVPNAIEKVVLSRNKLGNNLSFLKSIPNVVTLWLSFTGISELNKEDFDTNKKLKYLRLDENSIADLNFLENLSEIVGLNVSSNKVAVVQPDTFRNLYDLQYLYLADNQISDTDFLKNVSNSLFSLTLSKNNISKLNASVFNGKEDLVRLALDFNNISDLTFISGIHNLERLIIDNNNISYVPETILSDSKINYLNLSNNNIDSIDFVQHSEHLEDLYARNNIISQVNFKLFDSSKIERLDLSSNRLKHLNFVSNIKLLKEIQIQDNKISGIAEDTFMENGDLEKVDLSGNNISSMDFVFYMSKVRVLKLTNCLVESTDESALKCSRRIVVTTSNKNITLSFIKSTEELWNECYGSRSYSHLLSLKEEDLSHLITFISLLCTLLLLLIIIFQTCIWFRFTKSTYNSLETTPKKYPFRK